MENNYQKIVQENLNRLFGDLPPDLEKRLPGIREPGGFAFRAFGLGHSRIAFSRPYLPGGQVIVRHPRPT